MTYHEIMKRATLEEMAEMLYGFIEPFLDGNKELELKAKVRILNMLKSEVSQ